MILEPGSKIHVITRRAFDTDSPRHFIGEVLEATDALATAEGFAFIRDPNRNQFTRRPDRRVRVISLVDAANVIFILPRDVDVAAVTYTLTDKQRLIVTDGKSLELDVSEFGGGR